MRWCRTIRRKKTLLIRMLTIRPSCIVASHDGVYCYSSGERERRPDLPWLVTKTCAWQQQSAVQPHKVSTLALCDASSQAAARPTLNCGYDGKAVHCCRLLAPPLRRDPTPPREPARVGRPHTFLLVKPFKSLNLLRLKI